MSASDHPDSVATRWLSDSTAMNDVLRAVDEADAWEEASACAGWTAAGVVDHVLTTQRDFLARHGLDMTPPTGSPAEQAATQLAHVGELLADASIRDQQFDGWFGPTTVGETLSRFYGFDLLVHRWDAAQAIGRDERFSDVELDRIEASADSFGDNLYVEGICRPAVDVPEDADRQARVLARLGRG